MTDTAIKLTKTDIAKKVLATAANMGSGIIVRQIVEKNVETTTKTQKVTVGVASFALGGAVADVARAHVVRQVDETLAFVQQFKEKQAGINVTND